MGLFDKIKDNAKTISIKAIEATREYDEDYLATQSAGDTSTTATKVVAEPATQPVATKPVKTEVKSEEESPKEDMPGYEEKTVTKAEIKSEEEPKQTDEPKESEKKENKTVEEDKPKPVLARHSRITEVPKEDKDSKPYRPFYKTALPEGNKAPEKQQQSQQKPASNAPARPAAPRSVVTDVSPQKIQDPVKRAIYARERAAMAALTNQRRLNGSVALYSTNHMNFKTKVYINRIEYSGSFGKNTLPVEQISWVKLRAAGTGVILETTEGKRVVMVIKPKDRLAFADAILKVQEMQPKRGKFKDTQTVRIDQLEVFGEGVDEIEKLAKLYDKGILTQEEFDTKKRQILGI